MTVDAISAGTIRLTGACSLDDAEHLLRALLEKPDCVVDWTGCESAHTAVVQVLMALSPAIVGKPASLYLGRWIEPLIRGRDIAGG